MSSKKNIRSRRQSSTRIKSKKSQSSRRIKSKRRRSSRRIKSKRRQSSRRLKSKRRQSSRRLKRKRRQYGGYTNKEEVTKWLTRQKKTMVMTDEFIDYLMTNIEILWPIYAEKAVITPEIRNIIFNDAYSRSLKGIQKGGKMDDDDLFAESDYELARKASRELKKLSKVDDDNFVHVGVSKSGVFTHTPRERRESDEH
jgi:hypothetical protein